MYFIDSFKVYIISVQQVQTERDGTQPSLGLSPTQQMLTSLTILAACFKPRVLGVCQTCVVQRWHTSLSSEYPPVAEYSLRSSGIHSSHPSHSHNGKFLGHHLALLIKAARSFSKSKLPRTSEGKKDRSRWAPLTFLTKSLIMLLNVIQQCHNIQFNFI